MIVYSVISTDPYEGDRGPMFFKEEDAWAWVDSPEQGGVYADDPSIPFGHREWWTVIAEEVR